MNEDLQDLRREIAEMRGQVAEVYSAIMGNKLTQDGGLVCRIRNLEAAVETLEEKAQRQAVQTIRLKIYQRLMWTSIGFVAASIMSYIITHFFD